MKQTPDQTMGQCEICGDDQPLQPFTLFSGANVRLCVACAQQLDSIKKSPSDADRS